VYNRALLASLIAHHGEEKAEAWAHSLVSNLARKPQGNDRAQAKAIWAGECDIAIMNSYYFGKMKFNTKQPEQQDWAKALTLVFLNQADRGQHVNISAGGIVKTSDNKQDAVAFLEWLTSDEAQQIYASVNYEYPVNPAVSADDEVASWGQFNVDQLPISTIAKLSPAAQMIIDRTGW
jgi:iron(III) transport system substrate-binding protein